MKKTKKIATVAVSALGMIDGVFFLLPVFGEVLFYDLLPYWVAVQTAINAVLVGCLLKECIFLRNKNCWTYAAMVLPLFAFTADVFATANGNWIGGLVSQYVFFALFVVALFVVHRINSLTYRRLTNLLWWVSIILTAAVYFTGATTNGAARWISIAGFQFQPSEMLKITLIMYLANQLAKRQSTIREMQIVPSIMFWRWGSPKQRRIWRDGVRYIFAPIVLTCAVILPAHTSSAVLAFAISLAMLFIGRVRWIEIWRVIQWALVGATFVAVLGLGRSHTAGGRISTWIELWTTNRTEIPVEDLSDTERSMIAIYNGGILGRGAGQSAVRVEMTHPESDYAFAFFVEEYGIGIAMILVALYVWIFFRAIEIFERCPKKFPAMLSLGVALLITGQALLHIMVTVNIIPETGQTLPLISRGGSSLLFTSIGLGMILSVSRQTEEGSHTE